MVTSEVGNQVQGLALALLPALLDREQVFLELRQLPGAAQGVGIDDIGRVALGVAVLLRLHVQHELRQRPVQACDRAAHEGEARARQLHAGVEVQADGLAQVHMVAGRKAQRRRAAAQATGRAPLADLHIARLVGAHRHALVGQVGHAQQQGAKFALDDFQPRGGAIELGLDRGHLGHHGVHALALGLEATDLLAQAVALALQVFGAGLQRLALVLQRREGGHIEVGLGVLALLKACNDGVEVFTEGEDV
jgi:hypothetical protein